MKESEAYNPEQPSELNFSFGGHLATNSLGLVTKGFFYVLKYISLIKF